MRTDHTPLQVFTVRDEQQATTPSPPARRAKYDHTLHLTSQPVSSVPPPSAPAIEPVLSAEIPPPEPVFPLRVAPRVQVQRAPSFLDRLADWLRGLWLRLTNA